MDRKTFGAWILAVGVLFACLATSAIAGVKPPAPVTPSESPTLNELRAQVDEVKGSNTRLEEQIRALRARMQDSFDGSQGQAPASQSRSRLVIGRKNPGS